jgi:glycosyltransferase involved in cell wall biosynthesis
MTLDVSEPGALHVGLGAHLLSLGRDYRGAGATWYIYNILGHLPAATPDLPLQYTAFLHEPSYSPPVGMRVRRSLWSTSSPIRRIAWEQLAAPVALRRERIDVLHAMAFVAPLFSPCPTVVTVLDLSFLRYPKAFKPFNRLYLGWMTRISVRRASRVIAISESTRQDVIALLGVSPDRVHRIYCGVDPAFYPASEAEVETFRQRKGLPERFILNLGTIEPRKNVARLVEAYASLVASDPGEMAGIPLVIAGGRGWLADPIYARVQELGIQDRVHFVGYVPEVEKRLWYSAATCFCYPSLYEGFGLPPLEAMACGVPVIASDVASLPEVVGDAGLTVSPLDTAALSSEMRKVLSSPSLRAELAARGRAQALRFSWNEAARQTAQIYALAGEG